MIKKYRIPLYFNIAQKLASALMMFLLSGNSNKNLAQSIELQNQIGSIPWKIGNFWSMLRLLERLYFLR